MSMITQLISVIAKCRITVLYEFCLCYFNNRNSLYTQSQECPKIQLGEYQGRSKEEWVRYMTALENLTCHCKLLGQASSQKSQRESKKGCGQFSLVFLVSCKIRGKQKRDFFFFLVWKYRMELRISSKAEQRDPFKSKQEG